ncbi:hypothetical protein WQQ_06830 [Hydrocarboniphaga effusa AP103]|uniref:Uncharacterized protein n=1 Tax=Hydrocarboniphaga effusa AP103 TaxID=1172194 RepID=I8I3F4_9GAMM|nr:hypothetical protein WQQ_06830 [Hydrocarboniphaga effusa AP103]
MGHGRAIRGKKATPRPSIRCDRFSARHPRMLRHRPRHGLSDGDSLLPSGDSNTLAGSAVPRRQAVASSKACRPALLHHDGRASPS